MYDYETFDDTTFTNNKFDRKIYLDNICRLIKKIITTYILKMTILANNQTLKTNFSGFVKKLHWPVLENNLYKYGLKMLLSADCFLKFKPNLTKLIQIGSKNLILIITKASVLAKKMLSLCMQQFMSIAVKFAFKAHSIVVYACNKFPFIQKIIPFLPYIGTIFYLGLLVTYLLQLTHVLKKTLSKLEKKMDKQTTASIMYSKGQTAINRSNSDTLTVINEKICLNITLAGQQISMLEIQANRLIEFEKRQISIAEDFKNTILKHYDQHQKMTAENSEIAMKKMKNIITEQGNCISAVKCTQKSITMQKEELTQEIKRLKRSIDDLKSNK